jgi:hypothetical protein
MARSFLFSLIGEETIPNYRAYKENPPDVLIHIYTEKTKNKEKLLSSLVNSSRTNVISVVVDGFDYRSVYDALEKSSFQFSSDDFLSINITGGTKMMALALNDYIRGLEIYPSDKIKFFYIDRNQKINWYLDSYSEDFCEPLEISEIVQLQGQRIKSMQSFSGLLPKFDHALEAILDLWESNSFKNEWDTLNDSIFSKVRVEIKNNESAKDIVKRFSSQGKFKNYDVSWNANIFLIYNDDGEEMLKLENSTSEIEWFLFNAGWFELLTAHKLSKKYSAESIFLNVSFSRLSNAGIDKNEVDILINDNGNLIFVECKSGKVSPVDLNTIKIRQETFGGLIAQNVLVLRHPLPSDQKNRDNSKFILEKCRDLSIQIKPFNNL